MTKKADDREERDRELSEEVRWKVAEEGAERESKTTGTAPRPRFANLRQLLRLAGKTRRVTSVRGRTSGRVRTLRRSRRVCVPHGR